MADGVSHSTVNRAYGVATLTTLYKDDEPDSPGTYFKDIGNGNLSMVIWDGEKEIVHKKIPYEAYKIMVKSNGYR